MIGVEAISRLKNDPVAFAAWLWPDVRLYDRQREILWSVWLNDVTVVPAAHMLGKDFVAGLLCISFFLTRHPCRIITTSVDSEQLEGVLWGEIRRFIQTARFPLDVERGGPLIVNHQHIRKVVGGEPCGVSYLIGRVAKKGEGLSGHHIAQTGDEVPRTLAIMDEASGVDQMTFDKVSEWANRVFMIGNPYDCANEFKWSVKGNPASADRGGDIRRPEGGFARKVIQIRAVDSPNVRLALAEQKAGRQPSGRILLPGVLPWKEYLRRRQKWDKVKQCVGLDAEFYEGAENLLFPATWLNRAEDLARQLAGKPRKGKAIGIDTGEGVANTSMSVVDDRGLIEQVSRKTPDTSVIDGELIAFARRWDVPPECWVLDRGGGGKQIADRLRARGYPVRTVAFGEAVTPEPRRGTARLAERIDQREDRTVYKNRRAQMYGELSELLDPTRGGPGFAIPAEYRELRRQLAVFPKLYDEEGRQYLPPKNKRDSKDTRKTLSDLLGCSPDESDSVALAVHGLLHPLRRAKAGAG